jgi:hypothetical protein
MVVMRWWGGEAYAVPEPVGGGGEANTAGADGDGEDLADDDPGTGTPGRGEEEDVDADECDEGAGGVCIVGKGSSNGTDDELADDHAESTPDEDGAAAETLNGPEGDGGRAHVDNGEDHGDQEGVLDGVQGLQEDSGVVEDEVYTSPLLHHLQGSSEDRAAEIGAGLSETALEAVGPWREVAALGDDAHLIFMVGNDLSQFLLDVLRVLGLAANTWQDSSCLLKLSVDDEVSGGFWEEEESSCEDDGWDELDGDRDAVRAGIQSVLGGIVDAGGNHKTQGDGELITSDNGTTNLAGSDFWHVQDDDGRDETDTETSDDTADGEESNGGGSKLQSNTNRKDTTAKNDGGSTSEPVREITSDNSAKEGTSRQDRDDERVVGRRQGEGVQFSGGGTGGGVWEFLELVDEILHSQNTTHVTGIVAEEETSKGSEDTHEVGLDGDGGLNAGGIRRGDDRSTSHCEVVVWGWKTWGWGDELSLSSCGWLKCCRPPALL